MELKKLQASFGRLDGAELELHSGLNVIEAPNESGKSTWAAFLRAMLYGVSTSDRVRNGVLPDRMRYQPWSGAPMAGQAELIWHDRDITLRRVSPGGGKPMGTAEAVYSGTEERVPELRAGVPGEVMLGVPEAVFRRSAFISGSDMSPSAFASRRARVEPWRTSDSRRTRETERNPVSTPAQKPAAQTDANNRNIRRMSFTGRPPRRRPRPASQSARGCRRA